MTTEILQFFLNRYKRAVVFTVFCVLLLPVIGFAQQANIFSVTAFPPNPVPGGTVAVTVVYCQNATFNNTYFEVALEPLGVTSFPGTCPKPGQILLVDSNNPQGPTPVLTSTRDDSADGGHGWIAGDSVATLTCPVTQVFNVTMPTTM